MSDEPAPFEMPPPPPFTPMPYDGPGVMAEGEGVIQFDAPPPAPAPAPLETGEPSPPVDYVPAQMATYAIGTPGEHPRFLLTAPAPDDAELQRREGEVVLTIETAPAEPYRIAPDGGSLESVDIPVDLGQLRANLIRQVNTAAGAFRSQFITDIPGQQATYLAKEKEARDWAPGSAVAAFPYLACEAAATGSSIADVVTLVLATATQWRGLDPRIEGARRGASVAIGAATTPEAAAAAAIVDWAALLVP